MQEFSKDIIELVWEKGRIVEGYDPALYRQDACGAWITRSKYGDRTSNFGWVVDHICPRSLLERYNTPDEAINDPLNLQPMQWANDMSKGESYPSFLATRYAVENDNIDLVQNYVVNEPVRQALDHYFEPFLKQHQA